VRAAIYERPGSPEVLRIEDAPDPVCAVDDVLIRIEAISLEGGDVINRAQAEPPPGGIVGYAAAGTIVEVGSAVRSRRVGQRVTSWNLAGSHAEFRAVPASRTWVLPDDLSMERAACIPIGCGTAQHCLFNRGRLASGETVLIQAGAGGVGLGAIQLAHAAGATVIATVSGASRAERLKAMGLDHAIDHRTTDVAAEVRRLTQGRGVDLVVDPVGSTLRISLDCLRPEGRLVVVGNAGGGTLDLDLWPALQSNQTIMGVFMGSQFEKPDVHHPVGGLLDQAARGDLEVVIDKRFSLAEAAAAHRYAETEPVFGRVVIVP